MLNKKIWILSILMTLAIYAENNTTQNDNNITVETNTTIAETNTTVVESNSTKQSVKKGNNNSKLKAKMNALFNNTQELKKSTYNFVGDR